MDREGGNRQRMRKSWEWISLHFLILSPFPLHFLILSLFPRSLAARLQRFVQPSRLPLKKQRTRLSSCMFLLLAHTHFSFSGVRSSWRISFPHSLIGLDRLSKLFLNSILFSTVLLCFVHVLRHSLKCEKSKFFLPSI